MVVSSGRRIVFSSFSGLRCRVSLSVALCLSSLLSAHAQSLVHLTEQAQSHDAQWQSMRAQLDATIARGEQAKAGLLPQIGLQAGSQYNDARTRLESNGVPASTQLGAVQHSAAIQAVQPLYNPANLITHRQGQRNVDLAYAQIDAARQDLMVRTANAYFSVLEAQDNLVLIRAQKRAVSEQFEFAKRNFEIGTATVTDSREAQARLDLVLAQEIAALSELEIRQSALEQLTGQPSAMPWPLIQGVRLPALAPADLQSWIDTSSAHSPMVRQAQMAVDIARLETDKAQAGHKPTVDLQVSYGYQRNPDGMTSTPGARNIRSNVGTVGVVMNLPLFAGFAIQNRVRESLSLEEKAQADLEDTRRQVHQAVRTAYFGIQSLQGQVQALEAAVESSQSALDANRLGYQVGVRINMDVLNAQSQLYQARRDLAQARYNLLLAHLQLRQASGVLSMQDIYHLNQMVQAASSHINEEKVSSKSM